MTQRKYRAGSVRPIRNQDEVMDRLNDMLSEGILLEKGISGEIITLSLAPNEIKVITHGLRVIPKYRLILRQTGNAVITDVNTLWTEITIGLKNESANAVVLTIKLMPG